MATPIVQTSSNAMDGGAIFLTADQLQGAWNALLSKREFFQALYLDPNTLGVKENAVKKTADEPEMPATGPKKKEPPRKPPSRPTTTQKFPADSVFSAEEFKRKVLSTLTQNSAPYNYFNDLAVSDDKPFEGNYANIGLPGPGKLQFSGRANDTLFSNDKTTLKTAFREFRDSLIEKDGDGEEKVKLRNSLLFFLPHWHRALWMLTEGDDGNLKYDETKEYPWDQGDGNAPTPKKRVVPKTKPPPRNLDIDPDVVMYTQPADAKNVSKQNKDKFKENHAHTFEEVQTYSATEFQKGFKEEGLRALIARFGSLLNKDGEEKKFNIEYDTAEITAKAIRAFLHPEDTAGEAGGSGDTADAQKPEGRVTRSQTRSSNDSMDHGGGGQEVQQP